MLERLVRAARVTDKSILARLEEMSIHNGGVMHFSEQDVFVADGHTRVLVNSIPELCNIIEMYAFEFAKSVVSRGETCLGRSMFTDSEIENRTREQVATLMSGKLVYMYQNIRQRLTQRATAGIEREEYDGNSAPAVLNSIGPTMVKVMHLHLEGFDPLIQRMHDAEQFTQPELYELDSLSRALCDSIADFVYQYCPKDDLEYCMDVIMQRLGV